MVLDKDLILEFLSKYRYLHDSSLINLNYDIKNQIVELLIDASVYEQSGGNKRQNIKLIFSGINHIELKEIFDWDFFDKISLEVVDFKDNKCFKFLSSDFNPQLLIVSENIECKAL